MEIRCVRLADTFLFYCNSPFGCRGEHCSPVRFTRYVALSVWLRRAVNDRPYKPTRKIIIAVKPRAGHTPPLPRTKKMCPRKRTHHI